MRRIAISYGFPLVLIAAFAGLMVFAFTKLVSIERDMRVEATENMLWVIHQAQVAALDLDVELARTLAGNGNGEIAMRYDVLLSRIEILRAGPQRRYLGVLGMEERFGELAAAIHAVDETVNAIGPGDDSAVAEVAATLAPFNTFLGRAATRAMVQQWDELGARLDLYRSAVWQIIASVLAITAIGGFISYRLIVALHRARLAADLEQTLEQERTMSAYYRSFAAMMSHQFRTPLAVIDSSMQRLVRRSDKVSPEEVAERAGKTRGVIRRLTRLVETTLDAARFDSGQVEARAETLDLTALVEGVCGRWQEQAPTRRIEIVRPPGGQEPVVQCDAELVEHILGNLLSNADKYSHPDAPVTVTISLSDDEAHCAVADAGIGIAADEMPMLFERFYRASTAAGTPGTGIGLNLARNLARLQGGDVTAVSREGEGSIFTLHLRRPAPALLEAAQ